MPNYYTYKQLLVRALVELQQEHGVSRSHRTRSFHRNTVNKKLRDFTLTGEVQIGSHCKAYLKKAVLELENTKVLRVREQSGYIALSVVGLKKHAESVQRYGPFDGLTPHKKSQFLKAIAGRNRQTRTPNVASQSYKDQRNIILSLRASLAEAKNANNLIAIELEDARRERDDLELTLLDTERPFPPPSHPAVRFYGAFEPASTSIPRPGLDTTMPSDRDSSPSLSSLLDHPATPKTVTIQSRPTDSLIQRPSGSFLNTISNQFTPSPSPERGTNLPAGSDDFDFEDVDMVDALEDAATVKEREDSDVSRGKQVQRDTTQNGVDSGCVDPTRDAQDLETLQKLAEAKQHLETLMQDLASTTQERNSLKSDKQTFQAIIDGCNDKLDKLSLDLTTAINERHNCERDRAATVVQLSAALSQSNAEHDNAKIQLAWTDSQLEAIQTRHQETVAELAATQLQLNGAQGDLITFWNLLQNSRREHDESQMRLIDAHAETDSVNAAMGAMAAELNVTLNHLQDSLVKLVEADAQLVKTNDQLDRKRSDLERLQADAILSGELRHRLHGQVEDLSEKLALIESDLSNTRQEAAIRERDLKGRLEEAQEQSAVLVEDLQNVRTAWIRANEMKQTADEMVRKALHPQRAERRDPSFRDSGVSMSI